jgi:hypothetical protein
MLHQKTHQSSAPREIAAHFGLNLASPSREETGQQLKRKMLATSFSEATVDQTSLLSLEPTL